MATSSDTRGAPSAHIPNSTPSHSGTFDPADWLAKYTALGGVYVANGKLNLCILVNKQTEDELSQIRQMVVDLSDRDKAAILAHVHATPASTLPTWQEVVAQYEAADAAVRNHPYGDALPSDPDFADVDRDHSACLAKDRQAYLRLIETPVPDHAALRRKVEIIADVYDLDDEATAPIIADLDRLASLNTGEA